MPCQVPRFSFPFVMGTVIDVPIIELFAWAGIKLHAKVTFGRIICIGSQIAWRDKNLTIAWPFGDKRGKKHLKISVNAQKTRRIKESKRKYSNLIIANDLRWLLYDILIINWLCLFSDAAYLHHWLSVTIHFNRYNFCFDKYTECRNKCKPLDFTALHIRVVPPLFSPFVECPLSDTRCWVIGHFRRYVTERLLNAKVVVFLEFLWVAIVFCVKICDWLE